MSFLGIILYFLCVVVAGSLCVITVMRAQLQQKRIKLNSSRGGDRFAVRSPVSLRFSDRHRNHRPLRKLRPSWRFQLQGETEEPAQIEGYNLVGQCIMKLNNYYQLFRWQRGSGRQRGVYDIWAIEYSCRQAWGFKGVEGGSGGWQSPPCNAEYFGRMQFVI